MKKIELKAQQFAKSYLKNKCNGTKTALEVYDTESKNTAHAIASENLQKPTFQRAILKEMEAQGLTDKGLMNIHKRNLEQAELLPSSNAALDMAYKLRGDYAPEKKQSISLNIDINNPEAIDKRIEELTTQLKELSNEQVSNP